MAKSSKIVRLIREIVKQEVQKEVREIFIKEGMKSIVQKSTTVEDSVMEVLPERKQKPKSKVTYTSNPMLNDILNETANQPQELEEYPTMGGETFDSSKMASMMGYGNVMGGNDEAKREMAAVQTAQAVGADTSNKAVQDVMSDLTKDYRGVMKALDKRDNK